MIVALSYSLMSGKITPPAPFSFSRLLWRFGFFCVYIQIGFPGGSGGKEFACNAGDLGLIPGLGRSPGEGDDNPLHYFA